MVKWFSWWWLMNVTVPRWHREIARQRHLLTIDREPPL